VSECSSLATGIPAAVVVGLGRGFVTVVPSWYVSGPVGAHPRSTTALAPSSWLAANSTTRQLESENSGQHESTLAAGGNAAEGCARQDSAGLREPPKSRSRRGRPGHRRMVLRRPGPSHRRGKPDGHRNLEGRAQPRLTTGRPQHTPGVGRCPAGRSSAGFSRFSGGAARSARTTARSIRCSEHSGCREGSCHQVPLTGLLRWWMTASGRLS
jgi:hypothetical protein